MTLKSDPPSSHGLAALPTAHEFQRVQIHMDHFEVDLSFVHSAVGSGVGRSERNVAVALIEPLTPSSFAYKKLMFDLKNHGVCLAYRPSIPTVLVCPRR